jgi:hypothetical protein
MWVVCKIGAVDPSRSYRVKLIRCIRSNKVWFNGIFGIGRVKIISVEEVYVVVDLTTIYSNPVVICMCIGMSILVESIVGFRFVLWEYLELDSCKKNLQ